MHSQLKEMSQLSGFGEPKEDFDPIGLMHSPTRRLNSLLGVATVKDRSLYGHMHMQKKKRHSPEKKRATQADRRRHLIKLRLIIRTRHPLTYNCAMGLF